MKKPCLRLISSLIGMGLIFGSVGEALAAPAPNNNSVLILGTTVTGGAASLEATQATAQGLTPVVVDAITWSAMTTAEFASYRAIIFGDPTCAAGTAPSLTPAIDNRTEWSPAINGNVIIAGSDEVFHKFLPGATQLSYNMIEFASDIPTKTGLMLSLSCYYYSAGAGTSISVLDQIGNFTVRGVYGYDDVHIVAVHPALAGTTDTTLSNWGNSVHEVIDGYPASFLPLAIARNATGTGYTTFADGSAGVPYIIARGETLSPILCGNGILEDTEQCDDGNVENNDGCSAQCKIEETANRAPDCSAAEANPAMLWPANHKMKNVAIEGITDPDMDPLTVTVNSVKQDEAIAAKGSGNTTPADAIINPDGSLQIRAERTGAAPKNGRVYTIDLTATDPAGLSCTRQVNVCVPHDQRDGHECINDGATYKSTE